MVSSLACMLLAEMFSNCPSQSQAIISRATDPRIAKVYKELMALETKVEVKEQSSKRKKDPPIKPLTRQEEMKKIEGSNFGCPVFGFSDGPLLLMQKVFSKVNGTEWLIVLKDSGIFDSLVTFILNMQSRIDISPRGVISLFAFLFDVMNKDHKIFLSKLFSEGCWKILLLFLKENMVTGISQWPQM